MPTENFFAIFNHQIRIFYKNILQTSNCSFRKWHVQTTHGAFKDAMTYVSLFLAIRSGNLDLRLASIKSMAAIFTAFDHSTYQRVIIAAFGRCSCTANSNLRNVPPRCICCVSVSGRPWHSVTTDKSHEMLINKDCKTSIIHSLPDYVNRIAQHMSYSLQNELFPRKNNRKMSVHHFQLQLTHEQNRNAQVRALQEISVLLTLEENYKLFHLEKGQSCTTE